MNDAKLEYRPVCKTKIFDRNKNSNALYVVNVGGARSSKTYSLIQLFIEKMFTEKNKNFLVTRKTFPSLKMSTMKDFIDLLDQYDYLQFLKWNKKDHTLIQTKLKNYLVFSGIDESRKIKSTQFNYILIDEANDFEWEDFIVLKTRMSGQETDGKRNKMFLALNPDLPDSWIDDRLMFVEDDGTKNFDFELIHSTYKDNPFLPESYKIELENLKNQDENYYKIYCLGENARVGNRIFNFKTIKWENIPQEVEHDIYGLDFGFNAPMSLLNLKLKNIKKFIITDKGNNNKIETARGDAYVKEIIYQRGLTNTELIALMLQRLPTNKQSIIYCDSAETDRIKEINNVKVDGFKPFKALKCADKKHKEQHIAFCKSLNLFIDEESENTRTEFKKYRNKVDKDGNVTDKPVEHNNHSIDGFIYGAYTHLTKSMGTDLNIRYID